MPEDKNKYFQSALSDFVHDFASGGAISHLADLGYTVTEIMEKLSFPTPKERVVRAVWKHYLEKGIIVLHKPQENETLRQVRYVEEHGAYGRVSLRQVVEEVQRPKVEYLPVSFGKWRYQDEHGFQERLKVLTPREQQYVLDLPWPLQTVWHVKDERMENILKKFEKDSISQETLNHGNEGKR